MAKNKPLTIKELRELLGNIFNDLPANDEELKREAKNTYLKYKRVHKDCINKDKLKKDINLLIAMIQRPASIKAGNFSMYQDEVTKYRQIIYKQAMKIKKLS